jgi:FtsH-binding integral membrane protein
MNENLNQGSRPQRVSTAVALICISLAVGVARILLEASQLSQRAPLGFVLVVGFATLAVLLFFTVMIGKRQNWARITFLVLFIIGVPFSILPLLQSLAKTPVSGILGIAQLLLQAVALVFIFQKASSEWFRSHRKVQ